MVNATFASRLKRVSLGDRLRRAPIYYSRARRLFVALEAADLERRMEFASSRVARVLQGAASPWQGEPLESWPLAGKADVQRGDVPANFRRLWSVSANTTGTTGEPTRFYRSLESTATEQAAIDHAFAVWRLPAVARNRTAVLRGENIKPMGDDQPPFSRLVAGGRRLIMSSNHLSLASVAAFVDELAAFRPDVLYAYPSSLATLSVLMLRHGLRLRIPATVCSSEVLDEATISVARDALHTNVWSYYGQAERVAFAYTPESNSAVHRFLPGYSLVELIPGEGRSSAEIVGSTLWNSTMPLVRYRTGDNLANPAEATDRVRFGIDPAPRILGRSCDYLLGPDGVRLMGIDHIPYGVPDVTRAQIVQEADLSVTIRVLTRAGLSVEGKSRLLANASGKLPPSLPVKVEEVRALETGAGGKTPFVIRVGASGGVRA